MTPESEARIVKAVEVAAICLAHMSANWIAVNYNGTRANLLLDQIEPLMPWKMQRYVK